MSDEIKLDYLKPVRSRMGGKTYYYYSRDGVRSSVKGEPGTMEFLENYMKIHSTFESVPTVRGVSPGTINHGIVLYYDSTDWAELKPRTQQTYRWHLEALREKNADKRLRLLDASSIKSMRDQLKDTPTKANQFVRTLSAWLTFCCSRNLIEANPLLDAHGRRTIKPLKKTRFADTQGWAAWPDPAIERAHTTLDGPCLIAFLLALYTGQRKGDVLKMRWDHIGDDGRISVAQEKTDKRLKIPLQNTLWGRLSNVERKGVFIVARRDGQPYTVSGFDSLWKRAAKRHGLAGLQFHGLRKNAVHALLQAGCSVVEASAVTGQTFQTLAQYAARINQEALADAAVNKRETATGKLFDMSGKLLK